MFSPQEHSARLNGIFFARFGGWSSFKGVVFQQLWVPIRVFIRAPLQCSSWSWSALSPAAREAIEAPEMGVAWDYSAFIVHIATAFLVTAVVSASVRPGRRAGPVLGVEGSVRRPASGHAPEVQSVTGIINQSFCPRYIT